MKKILFAIIFTSSIFLACGQRLFVKDRNGVNRQKQRVNQNCISYEGLKSVYEDQNYLLDEPKPVSENNFRNYISNYLESFPKTTIRFCIIFQPGLPPCCRQTDIADSLAMDTKQLDSLTKIVLKYPVFSKVQFNMDEKGKYLVIYMSRFRKNPFSVGFGYK